MPRTTPTPLRQLRDANLGNQKFAEDALVAEILAELGARGHRMRGPTAESRFARAFMQTGFDSSFRSFLESRDEFWVERDGPHQSKDWSVQTARP